MAVGSREWLAVAAGDVGDDGGRTTTAGNTQQFEQQTNTAAAAIMKKISTGERVNIDDIRRGIDQLALHTAAAELTGNDLKTEVLQSLGCEHCVLYVCIMRQPLWGCILFS